MKTFKEYSIQVRKADKQSPNRAKVVGIIAAFQYCVKNKWHGIGKPVPQNVFSSIIRSIGRKLAEELYASNDIKLPLSMGKIKLSRYDQRISIENGKVKTNSRIDWDSTLKLWYEDEESRNKKTLVRYTSPVYFTVKYSRDGAYFKKCSIFSFRIARSVKQRLSDLIHEGSIEAFKYR